MSFQIDDCLRRQVNALEADTKVSLAFGRAALQALAAISPKAREAIDLALAEEAEVIAFDRRPMWAETLEAVNDMRRDIETLGPDCARARLLESLIVAAAEDHRDGGQSEIAA